MEKPKIPILAETATAVLDAALKYPAAGFQIIFNVIGEGQYFENIGRFTKIEWRGNIPLNGETQSVQWILEQIRRGFVTISVQSSGKNPHYYREIHRARGVEIPI